MIDNNLNDRIKKENDIMKDDLFVTIIMTDGTVLNNAQVGFLMGRWVYEWIRDKDVLKRAVNNIKDLRFLAFRTDSVQGKLIKENVKSVWFCE